MNVWPCDPSDLAAALFTEAEDALFLFEPGSGRILDANPAALRLAGCARHELLARPIAALFAAEPPVPDAVAGAGSAGSRAGALFCASENRAIPVLWTVHRLAAQPKPLGLLSVRDVSSWQETEAALRESRHRFDAFMNNIPLVAFAKDFEGRMTYVNQAYTTKFGLPAPHFLGKTDHDLYPAEVAQRLRETDLQVMAGTQPVELREHVPTRDGVLREWWVAKFPFHDSHGRVFLGGIALDLTERMQIEEALRRSEERYRQLWQRNLAGIVRATLKGRILDCNDSFAHLFGFGSRAEMLNHSTKDLYFDRGVREEFVTRLRENQFLTNYELCMRRADGAPVWVLENVGLISEGGEEILEGTLIDITDRKRVEEALRASEANYRTLIDHLDQGIFLKDRELRYVTVNPVFCAGVGRTEEELRGKTISEAYPNQALTEKSRAIEQRVLAEGRVIESEEVLEIAGTPRNVRVCRTPVKDLQGAVVGVLGICWDVTAQRALETQLRHVQKMDAIGQLAGGIAHDFNNLLTIMLGNLSYILAGNHDLHTTLELVKNVEKAGLRAAELTQTLLGFSRGAALATAPCNLNEAIEEVVRLTRTTLPASIALEVRAAPRLWSVEADPSQLNQVLTNLTLNARDAMPDGGTILYQTSHFVPDAEYLAAHVEARAGEFVRLRVHDSGPGMPAELRQRIFEPFFTTKANGKGSGLGLAIVFSIVKQHRGWIVCASAPGRGTSFDIFLPRCHADAPRLEEVVTAKAAASPATILLVDDESMIRQLTRTILEKAGYDVLMAEDGAKAVELYDAHHDRIALIILDAIMPRLSGRDALRELARRYPHMNVLFSSGYSTEALSLAEFPQVRGFLPKPYRAEQLLDAVAAILGQAQK
jgi:PAS domain S-box-containing protein